MANGSQNNVSYQAQKWTNLRTFTIGETGKDVDGTTNISWSKDEILGASDSSKFLRGDKTWSDTLTGNLYFSDASIGIQRVGRSTSWIGGRDGTLVRTTSISGYSPIISMKTTNGTWEIGAYDNSSYTNKLIFSYATDANYNVGSNSTSVYTIDTSGHYSGNAASATKLQTARSLWGNSFNGTADISGSISMGSGTAVKFTATAGDTATSTPTALTYGRLQAYGTLCINANTDNSGTEYVILTAGHGMSSSTAEGFWVGSGSIGSAYSMTISHNTYPSLTLNRTDSGETSLYFKNATAGWAIGVAPWSVGAGVFAIGQYAGTGSSAWRFKIDNNGYCFTRSYLNLGGGHEKNASSPSYIWGSNSSDTYLRSYQTGYLNVNSAGYLRDKTNGTASYLNYGRSGITSDSSFTWVCVWNGYNVEPASKGAIMTAVRGNASGSWGINVTGSSASCTGNAAMSTKTGDAAIWLYAHHSNEINFGGTNTSTTIYFGYRAVDSRPIPDKFIFGGSGGNATLKFGAMEFGGAMTSTGAVEIKIAAGYSLALQADGNLVWYQGSTARWNAKSPATWNSSSKLLKENIQPLTDLDLTNFKKLNVISYNYKKGIKYVTPGKHFGLLAEEVLPLYPHTVDVPDDYDESKFDISKGICQPILRLDYVQFVPLLIKIVQNQQDKIESLEHQMNQLILKQKS